MNIERNFEATLWRHRWRHHHKKNFLGIIGTIFSYLRLNWAVFNISKFSKWLPFWARQTFFTGSYTGSWIYQKDNHEHFRYFELLIDAVTQIMTEIYQFQYVTYFVTWWCHQWGREYSFIIWIGNAYVAVAEAENWNKCICSLLIYTGKYNTNLIGRPKQCVVYRLRQKYPHEILGKPNNTIANWRNC